MDDETARKIIDREMRRAAEYAEKSRSKLENSARSPSELADYLRDIAGMAEEKYPSATSWCYTVAMNEEADKIGHGHQTWSGRGPEFTTAEGRGELAARLKQENSLTGRVSQAFRDWIDEYRFAREMKTEPAAHGHASEVEEAFKRMAETDHSWETKNEWTR